MDKQKYICPHCGSDKILHDAWASWSPDTRSFTLQAVFDDKLCEECEAKFRFLEPVTYFTE